MLLHSGANEQSVYVSIYQETRPKGPIRISPIIASNALSFRLRMENCAHSVVSPLCDHLSSLASCKPAKNATDDTSGKNANRAAKCADLCVVGRVWRGHGSVSSWSSAGVISLSGHWDWGSGSPFSSRRLWRFMYW